MTTPETLADTNSSSADVLPQGEAGTMPETTPVDGLIEDKFRTTYGVVMGQLGNANPTRTAHILYGSIFTPGEVVQTYGIHPSAKFPDRISTLEAEVPVSVMPDETDFVAQVREAMTTRLDHEACLYPGALDAVETMIRKGPTAIWTKGDVRGYNDTDAAGSNEQLKKIALSPITDLRRRLGLGRAAAETDGVQRPLNDVLTAVASEDKFSDESIGRLVGYMQKYNVTNIVVLEDRLEHLQKLQEVLEARTDDSAKGADGKPKPPFTVTGIWVRQGQHGEADKPYDPQKITAVSSITAAAELIQAAPEDTGIVTDFDGVLSNQRTRLELQVEAVQNTLHRNGWIGE